VLGLRLGFQLQEPVLVLLELEFQLLAQQELVPEFLLEEQESRLRFRLALLEFLDCRHRSTPAQTLGQSEIRTVPQKEQVKGHSSLTSSRMRRVISSPSSLEMLNSYRFCI